MTITKLIRERMNATALNCCSKVFTASKVASTGEGCLQEMANLKREMSTALPMLSPEIFLSDRSLVAVYCFIKNFIG